MGLAGLEQTQKLGDARIFFRRATTYDATRATYFLYLGWVELALGDFAAAKSALNEAAAEVAATTLGQQRLSQRAIPKWLV